MFTSIKNRVRDRILFGEHGRKPFKSRLTRRAGETLEEKLDEAFDALTLGVALALFGGCGLAASVLAPSGAFLSSSIFLAVGIGVAAVMLPRISRIAKGLSGEREVGAELEGLMRDGAHILHDFPAGNSNVDHIVISTHGIYAIETKYRSKLLRADNRLSYRGGALTLNGAPLTHDPLPQAHAAAKEVRRVLESLGYNKAAKPVVLFPGWYVDARPEGKDQPWVLAHSAFAKWVRNEPTRMTDKEAAEIAGALRRYASINR
jgi:hypothetical protein